MCHEKANCLLKNISLVYFMSERHASYAMCNFQFKLKRAELLCHVAVVQRQSSTQKGSN